MYTASNRMEYLWSDLPGIVLLHQVDWDSALRNDAGIVNELGLYDLDRNIMPVGEAYKKLIHQWKDIISEESFGLIFQNW